MKLSQTAPPEGTVRDWLTSRAQTGGTAMTFPETNEDLSWQKLHQDAARIAGELTSQGLAKGESVAIVHPNGAEGITAFYAALYGGFRATMINLAAGPDAIAYALAHSEARTAFVHVDQRAMFDDVRPEHMNLHQPSQSTALLHDLSAADDALLMYTSGTTGRPKGVVHTHASPLAGGWTTTIAHKLGPEDRGFCVLPIYHINGLCVTVMGSLVSGGSLAMVSKFSASRFWAQCQAGGATWFSVVPTIISHLLHGQATPSATVMGKLRFGHSASSALAVETQNAFQKRFGISIVETMGLTETAAQCLSNPLDPAAQKIGSPGIGIGNAARIADDAGKVAEIGDWRLELKARSRSAPKCDERVLQEP